MRPEHVLFVDDNELLRSMMTRFLKKEFRHVAAVGTGTEAMKEIEQNFFHVVILDKSLPDVDGFNVLGYIKDKSPHSRVVMITSNPDENIMQEALRRGAFDFFEKPFDIDKLKATLRGMRVFKALQAKIDGTHEGVVCNLSNSGMLMMTDAALACGDTVDLLLHTPDNSDIPLKGKVIRTADSGCNSPYPLAADEVRKYAVGIRLLDPPRDYFSLVDSMVL